MGTPREGPVNGAGRSKVLVAEDEPALAAALSEALNRHFHVIAVGDGLAAVEAGLRERPDAVVMDVLLPAVDGVAAATVLHHRGVPAPVILITGIAEYVLDSLPPTVQRVLAKPLDLLELVAAVRAVLPSQR